MTEKLDTDVRRDQIVEAALAVLGTRSVQDLGMADIARRVGLVPSAIYRHFRSKDEVLDAVLQRVGRRLLENVRTVRAQTADPLERLRRLLMQHAQLVRENQCIPRLVFSEAMAGDNSARRSTIHGIIRTYLDRLGEIAEEGQREGVIRPDLDGETVALLLLGIVQPGAVLWHLSEGKFDVTRHAQRAWRLLRAAIAAEGM